jgi:plasmid stabilization system protein ParE
VRIVWSPEAQSDLAAIYEYHAEAGSDFAFKAAELAVSAARLLAERPRLGPMVENTDYRKWRVPTTPYLLIYRSEGERLRIARVFHVAQDWQDLL